MWFPLFSQDNHHRLKYSSDKYRMRNIRHYLSLIEKKLNQTVTDSPAFQRWFKGSKVVDASGQPLKVYHGTKADIEVFKAEGGTGKTFGTGSFFTANPKIAGTYVPYQGGSIYPVYLRILKPFVVDVGGSNWNSVKREKSFIPNDDDVDDHNPDLWDHFGFPYDEEEASTDDIAVNARLAGYDGVIIQNVKDRGGFRHSDSYKNGRNSTIYVAFTPNQVKSVFNREFSDADQMSEEIDEGFAPAVNWRWTERTGIESIAVFKIGKVKYTVSIFLYDSTINAWDLSFVAETKNQDFGFRASNTGNQWTVLGTVIKIAQKFIEDRHPKMVRIESDTTERSRLAVNRRIAGAIAQGSSYTVSVDDDVIMITDED